MDTPTFFVSNKFEKSEGLRERLESAVKRKPVESVGCLQNIFSLPYWRWLESPSQFFSVVGTCVDYHGWRRWWLSCCPVDWGGPSLCILSSPSRVISSRSQKVSRCIECAPHSLHSGVYTPTLSDYHLFFLFLVFLWLFFFSFFSCVWKIYIFRLLLLVSVPGCCCCLALQVFIYKYFFFHYICWRKIFYFSKSKFWKREKKNKRFT